MYKMIMIVDNVSKIDLIQGTGPDESRSSQEASQCTRWTDHSKIIATTQEQMYTLSENKCVTRNRYSMMLFVIVEKQSATVGTSIEMLKYYYHYHCYWRILTILPMIYVVYTESKSPVS